MLTLHAYLLIVCTFLGVAPTPSRARILDAIEQRTQDRHEAMLLVVFADGEGHFSEHPELDTPWVQQSWDVRAGIAHGPWEIWGEAGLRPLPDQVSWWLMLYHEGQRICPDAPLAPLSGGCDRGAARRIGAARELEAERLESMVEVEEMIAGVKP